MQHLFGKYPETPAGLCRHQTAGALPELVAGVALIRPDKWPTLGDDGMLIRLGPGVNDGLLDTLPCTWLAVDDLPMRDAMASRTACPGS